MFVPALIADTTHRLHGLALHSLRLFSGSCRKPHNALAGAAVIICSQRLDVFSPEIQRLTFFCGVARAIVDAGDAGLVPADVFSASDLNDR